ncbi:localization factor PodJL [Rhodopseudomonas julia]|uniref:Localization factor PodJL n=1 Tax=Rhodopseudomonas julia TaxID=200617 RepID=A0ABU0C3M6_9BRAD|nr:peptidoglycan-binding protein [Rhodopseudomonas julia]MDQ0325075.1 localization factor PodJL [Rhodopseudomonas julia]
MKARTSWRGRAGSPPRAPGQGETDLRALLNARFDAEGRIIHEPAYADSQAERLAGEGDISTEHLQAAVEALARRIDEAERGEADRTTEARSRRSPPAPPVPGTFDEPLTSTPPSSEQASDAADDLLKRLDAFERHLEELSRGGAGRHAAAPEEAPAPEPRATPTESRVRAPVSRKSASSEKPTEPRRAFAGGLADFARDLATRRPKSEAPAESSRPAPADDLERKPAPADTNAADKNAEVLRQIEKLQHALEDEVRPSRGALASLQERMGDVDLRLQALHRSVAAVVQPQALSEEIAAIRIGLAALPQGKAFDAIEARLAELAGRIDAISQPHDRGDEDESFARIESRLDMLAAAMDEIRDNRIGAIDDLAAQLDRLAERIEGLGENRSDLGPVEGRLSELSERIQTVPDTRPMLTALDDKLTRIATSLDDRSVGSSDIEEITQRLDRLAAEISGFLTESEERFSLKPVLDRLSEIDARFAEERVDVDQLSGLVARMEDAVTSAPIGERFAALEARIQGLDEKLPDSDSGLLNDIVDLRSEIAELRADIRNSPPTADAGVRVLQPAIREIKERLDRLPEEPARFNRELEAQIGRISAMLDRPAAESKALTRLEDALADIRERLDRQELHHDAETWHAAGVDTAEGSEALARLASALQHDLGELKSVAEASEERTLSSLDAVHETLEAVVKRMAFLERDLPLSGDDNGGSNPPAPRAAPHGDDGRPSGKAPSSTAPSSQKPGPGGSVQWSPRPPAPEPEKRVEDTTPSGLLSRLSATQLLKRATGGRAESFVPRQEEEVTLDALLEPGGGPLHSDLADAPSSASHYISAARKNASSQTNGSEEALAAAYEDFRAQSRNRETSSSDFLSAARRAARAAAAEAAAAERDAGRAKGHGGSQILDFFKARRRLLVAGAVALAVAFAAVQFVKVRGEEARTANSHPAIETPAPAPKETEVPGDGSSIVQPSPASGEAMMEAGNAAPLPRPDRETAFSTRLSALPGLSAQELTPPARASAPKPEAEQEMALDRTPESSPPSAPAEPDDTEMFSDAEALSQTASITPPPSAQAQTSAPMAQGPAASHLSTPLPASIGSEKLRRAAETGVTEAQFEVAVRYAEGRGVASDQATAVAWYERAARGGLAPAQYRLGSIYEKGRGVPKDIDKALSWYGKAADAGNVKAMHNLAVLYAEGADGAPDLEKAADLFERAAERGVRDSQFNIAVLFARGLGVKQDLVAAYKWFAVAARSGDQQAKKRQQEIADALPQDLLPEAKKAAETFKALPIDPQANMVFAPESGWGEHVGESVSLSGPDLVKHTQDLLSRKGYDPGPADGIFGKKTRQAIASFQKDNGLSVTGEIDTGIIKALEEKDI